MGQCSKSALGPFTRKLPTLACARSHPIQMNERTYSMPQCNPTSYDTLTTDNPAPVLIKL